MDKQSMVEAVTDWLIKQLPGRVVRRSKGPTGNSVEAWDFLEVVKSEGGIDHEVLILVLGIHDDCFTSVWSAQDIIAALKRQGAVDYLKKGDNRLLVSRSNELVLELWL